MSQTNSYDNNGNLAKTILPVGTTEYEYDSRNRVTSVINKNGENVLSSYNYTYYNNDLEKTKTDNSGKTTNYTYGGAGRVNGAYH